MNAVQNTPMTKQPGSEQPVGGTRAWRVPELDDHVQNPSSEPLRTLTTSPQANLRTLINRVPAQGR